MGRLAAAVEVEWVPGDHYSLVRPPCVAHLARLLAARLGSAGPIASGEPSIPS